MKAQAADGGYSMLFDKHYKIIFHNEEISYDTIRSETDRIKAMLTKQQIPDGEIVGLALKRTPLMLETIMALLENRIPFLPIQLGLPEKRLRYMLDNAGIRRIITTQDLASAVSCGRSCITLDEANHALPDTQPRHITDTEGALAYVLYTSGSTGNPKAVSVKRKGLENFLHAIPQVVEGFNAGNRIACFTEYTFDIFFLESVLALFRGMTVVLADEMEAVNPAYIAGLIQKHGIDLVQMTPSRLRMLHLYDPALSCLKPVRTMMVGGECFPLEMLETLKHIPGMRIYNMYGPTETTIWSTVSELTDKQSVDIGRPIANTEILILDEKLSPLPDGEKGEICIAGDGLAAGYLNAPEQTAAHFVTLADGRQIYRTGDIGYYGADGILFCEGRMDHQIKLNGHRIELEDIEQNLMSCTGMKLLTVVFDRENNRLICFYAASDAPEDVRRKAAEVLPDYMIPAFFVQTEKLLYTSSGKADRNAMLAAYQQAAEEKAGQCSDAVDTLSQQVCAIMAEKGIVCSEKDADRTLTELGVSSLDFIELVVRFEETFDIEFDDDFLSTDQLSDLGSLIEYIRTLAGEQNA